jgi:hypothetical protein
MFHGTREQIHTRSTSTYDGEQGSEAQRKALTTLYALLDDVFIFLIDDYSWTREGGTGSDGSWAPNASRAELTEGWWNGLYVSGEEMSGPMSAAMRETMGSCPTKEQLAEPRRQPTPATPAPPHQRPKMATKQLDLVDLGAQGALDGEIGGSSEPPPRRPERVSRSAAGHRGRPGHDDRPRDASAVLASLADRGPAGPGEGCMVITT